MPKIKVIKNEEKPEPKEILAEAIVRIGEGMQRLKESGLNERAIVALIMDYTKGRVNKSDVQTVFEALRQLRAWYCR